MIRTFHSTARVPELREVDGPMDGSWLYVEAPTVEDLEQLSDTYSLDPDLLLDGIDPNEAPRIEKDGQAIYIFTRYCLAEKEKLTTSPMLIIHVGGVVITICRRPFTHLSSILAGDLPIITSKRTQMILQLLTLTNRGYKQRINLATRQILQIRAQLEKTQIANEDFIRFIDIEDDLNDFLLVLEPMATLLNTLYNGKFVRLYEDDRDLIEDLQLSTDELTLLAQSRLGTLRNIREAYSTITANNLNRIFKLMTSITILMGIFTLITGIYSMNIKLPEAQNPNAFWIIIGITSSLILSAAWVFKRKRWF